MSVEQLVHKASELVIRLEPTAAKQLKKKILSICGDFTEKKRLILVRFPSFDAAESCIETPEKFSVSCGVTQHTPDCLDAAQAGVPPLRGTDVALGVFIDVEGVEQPVGRVCVYGSK